MVCGSGRILLVFQRSDTYLIGTDVGVSGKSARILAAPRLCSAAINSN
jgi:hypothetical protein